jgi:hypothetical protein
VKVNFIANRRILFKTMSERVLLNALCANTAASRVLALEISLYLVGPPHHSCTDLYKHPPLRLLHPLRRDVKSISYALSMLGLGSNPTPGTFFPFCFELVDALVSATYPPRNFWYDKYAITSSLGTPSSFTLSFTAL